MLKLSVLCFILTGCLFAQTEIQGVQRQYIPGGVDRQLQQYQDIGVAKFQQYRSQPESDTYFVFWSPDATLAANPELLFTYRQERSKGASALRIKYPFKVTGQRKATFTIKEHALKKFGPVTGWQVQVQSNGRVVAEKKSPTWR